MREIEIICMFSVQSINTKDKTNLYTYRRYLSTHNNEDVYNIKPQI